MMNIGFWELLSVGVVALLVVGPERMPEFARASGRWLRRLRMSAQNLSRELEREMDLDADEDDNEAQWRKRLAQKPGVYPDLNKKQSGEHEKRSEHEGKQP